MALALFRTYKAKKSGNKGSEFSFKKIFPWFILYFIGASIVTTIVGILPESDFTVIYSGMFVKAMKWLAKFFIAMAMCAIGLNTNLINLVKKGGKPILMGFTCWAAITAVSIGVQLLMGMFIRSCRWNCRFLPTSFLTNHLAYRRWISYNKIVSSFIMAGNFPAIILQIFSFYHREFSRIFHNLNKYIWGLVFERRYNNEFRGK